MTDLRIGSVSCVVKDVGFESLERVFIENPVTIRINNDAFCNCDRIYKMVLGDQIETIGDFAFYGCSSLKRIRIPEKLKYLGNGAFAKTAIRFVEIPEGIEEIPPYAFADCYELVKVILPKSVKKISQNAFVNCYNLTTVVAPGNPVVHKLAFLNCTSMK